MDTPHAPPLPKNIEDAVFDTALTLENEEERNAFLRQFFHDSPRGLARMQRLLELSGESSALFLDICDHGSVLAKEILIMDLTTDPLPDIFEARHNKEETTIGPYVLIARIGEGGGGVVYEAEQREPVHRRVALKVLQDGMDTEGVIARFAAERQALALMDHPNIAHVYDAGATATGRPYFAMERVGGERITTFCDRHQLGIIARIQLFIQVCNAIQHAHQKGVVHRDIKPSNILVAFQDGAPSPKVIDFGIAKATDAGLESAPADRTMLDQIIGTPPYMSPEQVDMNGIDVDTRSDIYSLGALLHELLGGRPPFDERTLSEATISEMRRILLEVEPPLISRRLARLSAHELTKIATGRNESPGRLIKRVRGDLELIVATATAKDRNRRYQTVNALATDLRRFLAAEPVLARRRPGRGYLLGRFIRRNRIACGFGALITICLLGGLGLSTMLYLQGRAARAEQARLGAVEIWLREQAQARANVSQADVLLSKGDIEAADALLQRNPPASIEPSREAARVFRALGEWNAVYGRWPQALQCFVLLNQANQLDNPAQVVEKADLLEIAPALLKGGDRSGYEAFRRQTLDRHLPVSNAYQAERILKVCLLTPANDDVLRRLEPTARVCEAGVARNGQDRLPEWEAFSMMLYHFRRSDGRRALEWAQKNLAYGDPDGSRLAAMLCVTAMVKFRSGERKKAAEDLEAARHRITVGAQFGPRGSQAFRGSWYSWVIAEILLHEATEMIQGKLPPSP